MLIINIGNGKGKTTAAMGQAVRALGHGMKVCIIQLFKGKDFYGEQKILKKLKNLDFYSFSPKHPYLFKSISKSAVEKDCQKALDLLKNMLKSRKHDLIVLDEFNIALRDGFIKLKDLLELFNKYSSKINIIITGRAAPKALIRAADLVTEMKEMKHPYNSGKKFQKGIEF
jgi:cob(I)alamin adenosyltransferase